MPTDMPRGESGTLVTCRESGVPAGEVTPSISEWCTIVPVPADHVERALTAKRSCQGPLSYPACRGLSQHLTLLTDSFS